MDRRIHVDPGASWPALTAQQMWAQTSSRAERHPPPFADACQLSSVRDHIAGLPAAAVLESQLRITGQNESADLGVKGSRVQISPARHHARSLRDRFGEPHVFSSSKTFKVYG